MGRAVRRIFLVLAAVMSLAAVASFGLHAFPHWSRARAATAWPTVDGTVVRCEVVAVPSKSARGGRPTYTLDLLVRYEVDGVTLVTDRDAFDAVRSSDDAWYRARADELRPGTTVAVQHDPADPGFALLRPEGGWIPFTLPGGFLVMAFVFALLARFARPPPLLESVAIPAAFRRFSAVVLGLFSLGFLGVGLFAVSIGVGRLRTLDAAATWPERDATIVRSGWTFESNGTVEGAKPSISYRYEVDGKAYESESLAPVASPDASPLAWNRRFLAWRPGMTVRARVDLADPSRAAIERPGAGMDLAGVGLAVGFVLFGVAGLVVAIRIGRSGGVTV